MLLNQADADAPFVSTATCKRCWATSSCSVASVVLQICKIENIVGKGRDAAMRVKWYYRPEETCSGRRVCPQSTFNHFICKSSNCGFNSAVNDFQAFHGANEVMASDHVETHLQPAASIVSKCKIHTLEQYMVSPAAQQYPDRLLYLSGAACSGLSSLGGACCLHCRSLRKRHPRICTPDSLTWSVSPLHAQLELLFHHFRSLPGQCLIVTAGGFGNISARPDSCVSLYLCDMCPVQLQTC